jgi:sec-independent protein translocase protein TatB
VFEGRFSEILIIFVLALIVLGPEKLPRVVSEFGRWVGRARAMARQFREQLEEEVQLEEARRAQRAAEPPHSAQVNPTPATAADAGQSAAHAAQAPGADERGT